SLRCCSDWLYHSRLVPHSCHLFHLIKPLATPFQVSIQAINLTITVNVVVQATASAFFAPMSDSFGRRPLLLFRFATYVAANTRLEIN
ncbi:uncharacterized protein BCR38DRAFT_514208, partial [Pseudomassariella vexata]